MPLVTTTWSQASIKDVCKLIVDCVNKTAPTVPEPTSYKMIRTTNVRNGWVNLSEVKHVTQDIFRKWTRRSIPQMGDVILTREAPLGEVGMLRSNETVFLGQRLVMYRADPKKLDNRFLLYAFQGDFLQSQIKSLGSGATVEHMRVPDCEKLVVNLPPLPTQRKIASVLSAYDDLIENNTRRIQILEEMAQSIYREWFVNFRFPGHEKVRMVDSPLGRIPEGWRVGQIRDIAELLRSSINPNQFSDEEFEHFSIPAYDVGKLPQRELGASIKSNKCILSQECVLLSKINPRIRRVWLPRLASSSRAIASTEFLVLAPKTDFSATYLFSLCSSDNFSADFATQAGGTSTSHQRVKPNDFMSMPIVVPSQYNLKTFEQATEPMLKLAHSLRLKSEKLRYTRDLLLPKLISGAIELEETS